MAGQLSNALVQNGKAEIIRELLQHSAKVESVYKYRSTTVYRAAWHCHVYVVCEVLNRNAGAFRVNKYGSTTLNTLASKEHAGVALELLGTAASVKISMKHNWAPFIIAAENGNMEVFRLLQNHVENKMVWHHW